MTVPPFFTVRCIGLGADAGLGRADLRRGDHRDHRAVPAGAAQDHRQADGGGKQQGFDDGRDGAWDTHREVLGAGAAAAVFPFPL